MFKTIRIEEFHSEVSIQQANGLPIKMWWGTACFYYTHPRGGSNSTIFLSFQYTDDEGWAFADYSSDT